MEFAQWYLRRGRINRSTYWLHYVLPLFAFGLLAYCADLALGFSELSDLTAPQDGTVSVWDLGPFSTLVSLGTLVPSVSSGVTRLHDRGHSAWWMLFAFVPLVGGIVLLVQMGFLRGDGGPNRYGPPPGSQPVHDPAYPPPW
jgi:uncharacterized membrane protein YhaH (DUF805 family)